MFGLSIRTAMALALTCASTITTVACSFMPPDSLRAMGPARGLNAFMGVHFGASLEQVERRFPAGVPQTSPYGAPAYEVEGVNSESVDYQDVIYEFTDKSGMQMAIAHFSPSECADVYQQLQTSFGAPSSAAANGEGQANVEASWLMPDGSSVLFSGPMHRLVLLGKEGGSLKTDIQLRDTGAPAAF